MIEDLKVWNNLLTLKAVNSVTYCQTGFDQHY